MSPFTFPVRVYWEDTDAGGVVFYANYLKYFERARTEWLRAAGVEQQRLRDVTGAMFVVAEVQTRYLLPAKLDDLLIITVSVQELGAASLVVHQQVLRGEKVLAEGRIRIGCVRGDSLRPCRIPSEVVLALSPG